MNDLLFEQVKQKLNVTWSDDETDARIETIIKNAIPSLKHRLGISNDNFDFSNEGEENTLFLTYCFYEWNHCLNEFEDNYSMMIATVRDRHTVEYYKSLEGDSNEE